MRCADLLLTDIQCPKRRKEKISIKLTFTTTKIVYRLKAILDYRYPDSIVHT